MCARPVSWPESMAFSSYHNLLASFPSLFQFSIAKKKQIHVCLKTCDEYNGEKGQLISLLLLSKPSPIEGVCPCFDHYRMIHIWELNIFHILFNFAPHAVRGVSFFQKCVQNFIAPFSFETTMFLPKVYEILMKWCPSLCAVTLQQKLCVFKDTLHWKNYS